MKRNLAKKKKSEQLVKRCNITDVDLQQHLQMHKKFKDYYCPRKSDNPIINLALIITFLNSPEVKAFYLQTKKTQQYKDKFVMIDEDGSFYL